MNDRSLDALAARLERLERECRSWRRGAAAVALGALVVLAVGAAADDGPKAIEEINVKRIVVRDDSGREAMTLGTQDGAPVLAMLADGQERLSIATPGGAPMMAFVEGGSPRLTFGLSATGTPVVNFNDADQRRRLSLGIYPKVGPMISVLDEQNKVIFRGPEAR
jgi:hypothetical protein